MAIIGYGRIGSQVSVLAEAMGMHVKHYDIETKLPLGNALTLRLYERAIWCACLSAFHVLQQKPRTTSLPMRFIITASA